jgi:hypothetical protein
MKEVVPFLTVDVIDYRSKNSNVIDKNDCHNNQENIDLLTEHKERGMLLILLIFLVLNLFSNYILYMIFLFNFECFLSIFSLSDIFCLIYRSSK